MAHEIKNILFLIVIGVFCGFYYLDILSLPQPEEKNLVIFLIGGITIFLVLELGRSIYRGLKNKYDHKSSLFQDIKAWIKSRQFILVVNVILYVIFVPIIGFFIATLLFIALLNYLLNSRKIWEITLLPIVLLILIYLLFVTLLGINLPTGILF
ncbi:tripartite tricarboxylate transporter TctB family protein [Oceanobacillus jeddahense]|uniref:Tripartite tricarboxylate transporter TctB family protein n=1 Tax=Oceanobacillus jeddahense TaxID=1462527 RepID=A0ABY5JQR6_9BACI|nr:tripartite tricarboxylate transporter TctB family protein [Oceanobacillus jeddahense]UUI02461.1 tripartite tricarboxylate transporter TctB family protein [Oceanobacillus jeddahense]